MECLLDQWEWRKVSRIRNLSAETITDLCEFGRTPDWRIRRPLSSRRALTKYIWPRVRPFFVAVGVPSVSERNWIADFTQYKLYAYHIQDGDAFLQSRANVCPYACDEKTTFPSQNLCMTTLVLMCVTRPQKIDVVDDSLFTSFFFTFCKGYF